MGVAMIVSSIVCKIPCKFPVRSVNCSFLWMLWCVHNTNYKVAEMEACDRKHAPKPCGLRWLCPCFVEHECDVLALLQHMWGTGGKQQYGWTFCRCTLDAGLPSSWSSILARFFGFSSRCEFLPEALPATHRLSCTARNMISTSLPCVCVSSVLERNDTKGDVEKVNIGHLLRLTFRATLSKSNQQRQGALGIVSYHHHLHLLTSMICPSREDCDVK